jgi:hypothetical protein
VEKRHLVEDVGLEHREVDPIDARTLRSCAGDAETV